MTTTYEVKFVQRKHRSTYMILRTVKTDEGRVFAYPVDYYSTSEAAQASLERDYNA